MKDRRAQLRVKIKNLADEAHTIRQEENRALGRRPTQEVVFEDTRCPQGVGHVLRFAWKRTGQPPNVVLYRDLRAHRRGIVRSAARISLLAYAMLRGVPYARCEQPSATEPDWARIRKMAERFGVLQEAGESANSWRTRREAQRAVFDAWVVEAKSSRTCAAA